MRLLRKDVKQEISKFVEAWHHLEKAMAVPAGGWLNFCWGSSHTTTPSNIAGRWWPFSGFISFDPKAGSMGLPANQSSTR
jgi:hypothetical protein